MVDESMVCIILDFAFLIVISERKIFSAICFEENPEMDKESTDFSMSENFKIGIFIHFPDRLSFLKRSPVVELKIVNSVSFLDDINVLNNS